jgi:hypothetical protein
MGLRGTLLSDGGSDRLLLPIIRWLLEDLGSLAPEIRWANPYLFPPTTRSLLERAVAAVDLEPCEILFVHRDAERESLAQRIGEIHGALQSAFAVVPFVCIVPVRMTEAWLLFDEAAIRGAAENPRGTVPLDLPRLTQGESLADPKERLRSTLCVAADLRGRHLKKFQQGLSHAVHQVAERVNDYGPIRGLPAFAEFERELRRLLGTFESQGRGS